MSETRRLAQELYEIRALALSHATSPQVGSSSVDGDGLVFRDGDGNDLGRIGGDGDGFEVEYLYGPKPDQPSAPIVAADANFINVRWDGLWADGSATTDPGIVEPGSLDRVEVHVSSDENFVPDRINSFAGVIPITPEGGTALVGPLAEAGDWYVVLMARGKDQQYGAPSERVHVVTTVGLMENELFDLALRAGEAMESADGKNSVYYGDEEPEPLPRLDENGDPVLDDDGNPLFNEFSEGDIWFGVGNLPHIWSDTDGWVSVQDARIQEVEDALAAFEEEIDTVLENGVGTKTFYSPTMPPAADSSEGDLWFDTDDGYRLWRFDGGQWRSASDQRIDAIAAAQDDFESELNTVRDTADGKNRTYYQTTMPKASSTPPPVLGDLWFDTSNGMRLHRHDGQGWVSAADERVQTIQDAQDALEADIDTVRTSVDGKSRITQSVDAPPAQYDGAVGDRWERMSSMGSGGQLISNWRWNGDVWVSTIISDAVLGNVDAAKIGTGFLDAARIKAGSISADRLVVGILQNLVVDARFKSPEINAARFRGAWATVDAGDETWVRNVTRGTSLDRQSFYLTTDGTAGNPDTRYAVQPESRWRVSIEVQVSSGNTSGISQLIASFVGYRADGTSRFMTVNFTRDDTGQTAIEPGSGWVLLSAVYDWSNFDDVVAVAPRIFVLGGNGGDWVWFRNPFIGEQTGATLIEDGAITTDKIATGAITAESGIIGSIDAGKITVGEMDGARIRAGSISADKVLIGNTTNLIPDPGGLGDIRDSWMSYGSGSVGAGSSFWRYGTTSQGYRGVRVGNTEGAFGSAQWLASSKFQVKPGEKYMIEVIGYRSELVGGFPRMGIRLGDVDDNYMGETETVVMDQDGFTTYRAIVQIPNDLLIKYGRLRYTIPSSVTSGYAYFFSPVVRPAVGATLIEPGAITTEKIATGAITAESGIIASLDAGKITVGQLDGARIKANSILASSVLINSSIGSTLIADGAITTSKIAVGAITAESGIVGSLDAGVITTGELRGELIRAGSIAAAALAATAIDGKTITGATVRTSEAGARVELNAQGLRQYNQFNQAIVDMTGGDVTVLGSLYSGVVGSSRVQIDSRLWAEGMFVPNPDGTMSNMLGAGVRVGREPEHSMDMFHGDYLRPGGASGEAGVLRGPGATAAAAMYMTDRGEAWVRSTVDGERRIDMSFLPDNSVWQSTSAWGGQNLVAQAHQARSWGAGRHGHHQVWATSNAHSGVITVDTGQASGSAESAMEWRARRQGSGADSQFILSGSYSRMDYNANYVVANASGVTLANGSNTVVVAGVGTTVRGSTLTLRSTDDTVLRNGRLYAPDMNTGSGTDLIITSNNYIGKKSSSRRYKIAEEPIERTMPEITDALMGVEVKTWFDRQAAERVADVKTANMLSVDATDDLADVDPLRRIPGVVAEDLDEAGLGMFVVYNPDGTPESVMYDRLGVALFPLVRDLRSRVDELETTLKEMADA